MRWPHDDAESPAVLLRDFKTDATYIITRSDVIAALVPV